IDAPIPLLKASREQFLRVAILRLVESNECQMQVRPRDLRAVTRLACKAQAFLTQRLGRSKVAGSARRGPLSRQYCGCSRSVAHVQVNRRALPVSSKCRFIFLPVGQRAPQDVEAVGFLPPIAGCT